MISPAYRLRQSSFGFGEDRAAVRDHVDRVAGLTFDHVFRLADAPGDAVPLRIGRPCLAFATIVVGGNRDVRDVLGGVDPAEASLSKAGIQ